MAILNKQIGVCSTEDVVQRQMQGILHMVSDIDRGGGFMRIVNLCQCHNIVMIHSVRAGQQGALRSGMRRACGGP
ncbi:hypothetical protein RABR111495_25195 [Rahnella bruchi]